MNTSSETGTRLMAGEESHWVKIAPVNVDRVYLRVRLRSVARPGDALAMGYLRRPLVRNERTSSRPGGAVTLIGREGG